jgi:hypothetical protein
MESIVRQLAILTGIKRARTIDSVRIVRNGDPGREERVAEAVSKIEAEVAALKSELRLP